MTNPQPCKGCTKRHSLCWNTCQEYQDKKAAQQEIQEEKRRQNDERSFIIEMVEHRKNPTNSQTIRKRGKNLR